MEYWQHEQTVKYRAVKKGLVSRGRKEYEDECVSVCACVCVGGGGGGLILVGGM